MGHTIIRCPSDLAQNSGIAVPYANSRTGRIPTLPNNASYAGQAP